MQYACKVDFENWYFHRGYARETDHAILLFGFQALFHLSRHVNSQDKMYWTAENSMLIHEEPPHDIMGGVWCAISATRIYMSTSSVIANSHRNIGTHSDNFLNTRPITTQSVSFFQQQSLHRK
jgi:hypothetical protein